ncbi:MraY family glycosyltransferase [Solirhodobacter olei]|uniref:MraY family glycosyltransferase n=1 Tax=Solirhodobacter olei TaxID=2493082 RepID=UPI000FDB6E3B|nr:glycosyltransferase [Solirhodobacter olei]
MSMLPPFVAFAGSLITCWLLVRTCHLHGHLTLDGVQGAQKIHQGAVPRVGGLGLAGGLLLGGALLTHGGPLWWFVVLGALPAFTAGLWEDLTKKVGVRARFLATIFAGALFAELTGYSLHHLDLWPVDVLLGVPAVAVLFTGFAIGGVANAMNIIDGCNGLAAGTAMILLGAFAAIAGIEGDYALLSIVLLSMAGVGGFFLINFPRGYIFLGDAGAYSMGFLIAAFAVALPARHADISPVIGLLVVIYPVSETLYSIVRRMGKGGGAVGQPDRLHLHSLTFKALEGRVADPVLRNSLSSVLLWSLPLISSVMAVLLAWQSPALVLIAAAANLVLYRLAYGLVARKARGQTRPEPRVAPQPAPAPEPAEGHAPEPVMVVEPEMSEPVLQDATR